LSIALLLAYSTDKIRNLSRNVTGKCPDDLLLKMNKEKFCSLGLGVTKNELSEHWPSIVDWTNFEADEYSPVSPQEMGRLATKIRHRRPRSKAVVVQTDLIWFSICCKSRIKRKGELGKATKYFFLS
tara:strand:+ start:720 stop:1100 length:381 start_codon:yes stop_codon:yes gene_type:complete